jgi:hypothetical protein
MSQNIDQAIKVFMQDQAQLAQAPQIEWRYYYDADGHLLNIAAGPPWPDNTNLFVKIEENQLNRITYAGTKIVQGQLIFLDQRQEHVLKLKEHVAGEHRTVNGHMSIKLEPGESYPDVKSYTQNTG